MLSLEQVCVEIDGRHLVDRVSLSLRGGELLGLIGPNGAGKSSLLKALAHLLPYQGEIRLDGELLSSLSPRQRALRCAYLGQGDQSSWPLRLRDYVALGRLPHRGNWGLGQRLRDEDQTAIDQALEQMGWVQGAIWSNAHVREAIVAAKEKRTAQFPALAPLTPFANL